MIKKYLLYTIIGVLYSIVSYAQSRVYVEGSVYTLDNNQKKQVLPGALLRWEGTTDAEYTDQDGYFKILKKADQHMLEISYVGFEKKVIHISKPGIVDIALIANAKDLDAVEVRAGNPSIDRLNPIQTEMLTVATLKKAACCNLSESFETNATISVNYTDAITGAKQIQMLGLSGNYVQTQFENIPAIRGLNSTYGLSYIPGTWINSIDIAKGVGSVVNGYESISGAIAIELVKPDQPDKIFVNTYLNSQGRGELNLQWSDTLNSKLSTAILAHMSSQIGKIDGNNDTFLDLPLYQQYNILNRWKYQNEKIAAQVGIRVLSDSRLGGQSFYNEKTDRNTAKAYGFGSDTHRMETFAKLAFLFPHKPYKGLGLIMNQVWHKNNSYFGFKNYSGVEKTFFANLIFQNIIGNTNHTYKTGLSYMYDDYNEMYLTKNLLRTEQVPGVFFEYNYKKLEKFNLLLGARQDFHNLYGARTTYRGHALYNLAENSALRLSAGTGWRVPNQLAENFAFLVNNRTVVLVDELKPEVAQNLGLSFTQNFILNDRKGNIIIDRHYTRFQNQLQVDMENHNKVLFYNQIGRSYARTYQIEANYNPLERFDIKAAYRLSDVMADFKTEGNLPRILPRAFVNKHRVLVNMGYAVPHNKWKFDFTWQWNGKTRIPDPTIGHIHTIVSPEVFAPAFSNINAQVTKVYKNWEFYIGGENLGNFRQSDPILRWQDPFGPHFDASMVWGPIAGRMVYTGLRWKLTRE